MSSARNGVSNGRRNRSGGSDVKSNNNNTNTLHDSNNKER